MEVIAYYKWLLWQVYCNVTGVSITSTCLRCDTAVRQHRKGAVVSAVTFRHGRDSDVKVC